SEDSSGRLTSVFRLQSFFDRLSNRRNATDHARGVDTEIIAEQIPTIARAVPWSRRADHRAVASCAQRLRLHGVLQPLDCLGIQFDDIGGCHDASLAIDLDGASQAYSAFRDVLGDE